MKSVSYRHKWLICSLACFFTAFLIAVSANTCKQEADASRIAPYVLRFHILAESNSKTDQELKLKVRDEIGAYLSRELEEAGDLDTCEAIVNDHLAEIENCAREVIAKEGHTETVSAQITDAEFPVKTYGAYTFPKGTYRALKVVIGDGAGANWWCVMYPNLCFANSVYEVIDENSKEELQTILTKEDYEEIMAAGKIRVRFKYFEGLAK